MKKRLFLGVMLLVLLLVLVACGGGGNQDGDTDEGGANDNITNDGNVGTNEDQDGEIADETPVAMKDGTFEGESEKDDRGAYGTITIVVEGGKITSADYEEIQSDGTPKGEDYQYQTSVDSQPKYEAQLVDKQDPEQIEAISGATATLEKFRGATNNAIDKAKQ